MSDKKITPKAADKTSAATDEDKATTRITKKFVKRTVQRKQLRNKL